MVGRGREGKKEGTGLKKRTKDKKEKLSLCRTYAIHIKGGNVF